MLNVHCHAGDLLPDGTVLADSTWPLYGSHLVAGQPELRASNVQYLRPV